MKLDFSLCCHCDCGVENVMTARPGGCPGHDSAQIPAVSLTVAFVP